MRNVPDHVYNARGGPDFYFASHVVYTTFQADDGGKWPFPPAKRKENTHFSPEGLKSNIFNIFKNY